MNSAGACSVGRSTIARAVTAIEYGLIAGLIAVAIVVGAKLLGVTLSSVFNTVAANVSTAASG